jgi:hypothetical protein
MELRSAPADSQGLGDLRIGHPTGNHPKHRLLPRGQLGLVFITRHNRTRENGATVRADLDLSLRDSSFLGPDFGITTQVLVLL